jgi:hypothetical protein
MAEQETVEGQESEAGPDESGKYSQEYVEGLRGEAKGYRLKLRESERQTEDLRTKLQEHEDAGKSEVQRLTDDKTRLERALADRDKEMADIIINTEIRVAASAAGAINVDDVVALLDRSEISHQDGKVVGVDRAIKKLVKEKPYLVKSEEQPTPPPTPGVGGPPIGDKTANLDESILGMIQSARPEQL